MVLRSRSRLARAEVENERLRRAVDELTMLNELATATAGMSDMNEILQTIIHSSMQVAGAEQGVFTLINEEEKDDVRTLLRTNLHSGYHQNYRPNSHLLGWMQVNQKPIIVNDTETDPRFPLAKWDEQIRSVISVPLKSQGLLLGVLTLYNKISDASGGAGFDENDQRLLLIIAAQSSQVISNARLSEERAHIVQLFGQHTSPAIVEQLLTNGPETIGVRKKVCVMFFDLRGFTTFSEQRMPEEVVQYLNQLFEITIEVVAEFSGIIHQLLGDGFMALFGAPISQGNDSELAVKAALKIVSRIDEECEAGRLYRTNVGIGMHTGEVIAGSVGTAIHKEYKVTGDVVNLAARIEGLNRDYESRILISESVLNDLPRNTYAADEIGAVDVRGRKETVRLFRLA